MRSRLLLRVLTVAHLVCLVRLLRRPTVVRASCSTPCRLGDECACWQEGWADAIEHRDPLLDEGRLGP